MPYTSLADALRDLEQTKQLVRIDAPVDPHLEMAAIQRRVYAKKGPALLFTRPKGTSFPMVSNLFGTIDRCRFLFRHTIENVKRLIELKIDPGAFAKSPLRYWKAPFSALHMLPKRVRRGAILQNQTSLRQLPQLVSWPGDGGPFITLPLVFTEDVRQPGWKKSNLGMYRVQLAGNQYLPDAQVGLHYQIHRGIGVHHSAALRQGVPLRVNIHVGGPPALSVAAVMPLPEGFSELTFAGALGGRRVRQTSDGSGLPLLADADFCITGTILPKLLPEGPFGDHLGYYAKTHDFPVLQVEKVYHRNGAVWPFTVVGRPPQEDTTFGEFIHELTGPIIPSVLPGVKAVHAVDAAGVHPLLLAIGSERYAPYLVNSPPMELLTQANAILGQGQLSLAKFLFILAEQDAPSLDIHDIAGFMRHVLERVDWTRDLHFQTCTTMDTLDYTGTSLNAGSKVVVAAVGKAKRQLPETLPSGVALPDGFRNPAIALAGVAVVEGPKFQQEGEATMERFCASLPANHPLRSFPLLCIVDDSAFTARNISNWVWTIFTRSNPSHDLHGVDSFTEHKHWGCRGPLVIDARIKPHHSAVLEEDAEVTKRVEAMGVKGGVLEGLI